MNIILFDDQNRTRLLPLTYTRPVAGLRLGILTLAEKWGKYSGFKTSFLTEEYLQDLFPCNTENENIYISGSLIPEPQLWELISSMEPNSVIVNEDQQILAIRRNGIFNSPEDITTGNLQIIKTQVKHSFLTRPWQIFQLAGQEILKDYTLLTYNRTSQKVSPTNNILGDQIFVEEGAQFECCTINTLTGPVYIGKNAEIMEGSLIRGPFALCEGAGLKMGSKVYGPSVIGPYSRGGGEISNSVLMGYSNKGHDGFLGNSVLGEWCNLGADTNNSNLKNNYSEVRAWSYEEMDYIPTGLQFCGLIMGDHSKAGINTMFNTGTVVGVCSNIFGGDFPSKQIPSFSWGGAAGFETFKVDEAIKVAERMYERRGKKLSQNEIQMLKWLSENAE